MSHLWIPAENGPWTALVLDGGLWDLDADPPALLSHPVQPAGVPTRSVEAGQVRVAASDGSANGLRLLVGPGRRAWVNGSRVDLGTQLLEDRDLIRVDTGRSYFVSTERRMERRPFPGAAGSTDCPRCTEVIDPGSMAVRCPNCGVWHHQNGERDCWTYTPLCSQCDQSTELEGAGFRWVPSAI